LKALNIICNVAFAATIIALPFLLVNWTRYMKSRPINRLVAVRTGFPTKSVSFFLVSALTTGAAAVVITSYASRDAVNYIRSLSGNYVVYVDGRQVRDSDKLISALKKIAPYAAHHSHPTKRIRVEIHGDVRELTLELGRDSDRPQEYWVFYPQFGVTSSSEIGRITTAALDEY
jgi:hypothetical protein